MRTIKIWHRLSINEPGDIWDKDCEALDYAIQGVVEKRERESTMTDIERAIKILENGKWWDYLCDNIPDEYHEDIYQATGLAIEALKEKWESRFG